jgi:TonB family protein
MNIKPYLKFSCDEDWNKMKIGVCSRHCQICNIDVIDFTNQTRTEILKYIYNNKSQKTCGRFRKSQLDFTYDEMLVVIESLAKKKTQRNFAFWTLTIGATSLLSCNFPSENKVTTQNMVGEITLASESIRDSLTSCQQFGQMPSDFDDLMILGEIMPIVSDENGIYYMPEKMPEFKGGIDSLNNYLSSHIVYPEWERKNNIEGVVIVEFIVDSDGTIKEPSILQGVNKAQNFDKNVLQIISEMPRWQPGLNEGKNVPVHFRLPIEFKLKPR